MRVIAGLLLAAAAIATLAACGSSTTDGSPAGPPVGTGGSAARGSGDSSLPMAQTPPDLAALPGGKDHLTPLSERGPKPDACKVLTPSMVLALIPGAGSDGNVTTPRSDTQGGSAAVLCQFLASPKGSDSGKGNIIVDFKLAGRLDAKINQSVYDNAKAAAKGKANFHDYGGMLGANSLAFYNPNSLQIEVLYRGQPFHVQAGGKTIGSDQDKWRDNVDVPIAMNIVARMNS